MATFPNSVVVEAKKPSQNGGLPTAALDTIFLNFATFADGLPEWGTGIATRDKMLRDFWPTENILSSAIFSTISRYAAFGWSLEGPPKTTRQVQKMLHGVERGDGWIPFITKFLLDLFTQDNGAFAEIVRTRDDKAAPVVSLNHLDSARCVRTGNSEEPVIYYDREHKGHVLKSWQVIVMSEFPSPNEFKNGIQYCAVTRLLRAAQIMRSISIYKQEKISGRFNKALHIVSGVNTQTIRDSLDQQAIETTGDGFQRYIQPLIIGTIDPTSPVSNVTLEMASLPDHFDEQTSMQWYLTQLAMAFGSDYQDFAPLPGGNLGSAQQSQVLHLKSRGKGPALFMRMLEHKFNFQGVMPSNVEFTFGEQDIAGSLEQAELQIKRAQNLTILVSSGIISPQVARQMLVDNGDLKEEYLKLLEEFDLTQPTTLSGSDPKTNTEPGNANLGGGDKKPNVNPTNTPSPKAGAVQAGSINASALAT